MKLIDWLLNRQRYYYKLRDIRNEECQHDAANRLDAKGFECGRIIEKLNTKTFDDFFIFEDEIENAHKAQELSKRVEQLEHLLEIVRNGDPTLEDIPLWKQVFK